MCLLLGGATSCRATNSSLIVRPEAPSPGTGRPAVESCRIWLRHFRNGSIILEISTNPQVYFSPSSPLLPPPRPRPGGAFGAQKKGASRGGGWGECPPGKLPRKKIWRRATLPPPSEAVPSPRRVLTSVFGMGTGMAPAPWPPEKRGIRYRPRSESELEAGHQDGGPVRASSLRARSGGPEEMAKPRGRLVAVS